MLVKYRGPFKTLAGERQFKVQGNPSLQSFAQIFYAARENFGKFTMETPRTRRREFETA
jgi:hypothetical protein